MTAPTVDMKDLLVSQGIGAFAASTGWGIYIGNEPDSPDTTITLFDTPGEPANPKFRLDYPRWQLRTRGAPNGYPAAFDKATAARNVLLGHAATVINTSRYDGIFLVTDTFLLKIDEKQRPIFVSNWRAFKEPASGGNRVSL
jgi:hypothetical protein